MEEHPRIKKSQQDTSRYWKHLRNVARTRGLLEMRSYLESSGTIRNSIISYWFIHYCCYFCVAFILSYTEAWTVSTGGELSLRHYDLLLRACRTAQETDAVLAQIKQQGLAADRLTYRAVFLGSVAWTKSDAVVRGFWAQLLASGVGVSRSLMRVVLRMSIIIFHMEFLSAFANEHCSRFVF